MEVDYYDLAERAVHRIEDEIGISFKNSLSEELIGSVYEEFLEYDGNSNKDSVGLTVDKKQLLKECMGSVSSSQIDFNKVRDEYKQSKELTIEDFHVGDSVKFIRLVGKDESAVEIGTIGTVIGIDIDDKYPVNCKIANQDEYGFLPSELEIVK